MPPLTIFLSEDAKKLLHNKYVVIIGDSNQRGIYKDFVALLQGNEYLSSRDLKNKGELHFMNDELVEGGRKDKMSNGIGYREVRQYQTDFNLVRFYFITKIHNKYWEEVIFPDLAGEPVPDVIIINSCLWDISRYERWGNAGMEAYKRNVEKTFSKLNSILPLECLVLWNTTLPVASKIKGGFILPQIKHVCETLRLDVMQANFYTKELAKLYDVDVLDLNFYFRHQMHRQVGDGTHWNYMAHRRITNLILAHIAVAWGVGLPRGIVPAGSLSPAPLPSGDVQEPSTASLYTDFDKVETQSHVPTHPSATVSRPLTPILNADQSVEQSSGSEQRKDESGKGDASAKGSETADSKTAGTSVLESKNIDNRSSPILGAQPSGDAAGGVETQKPLAKSDGAGDHCASASSSPAPSLEGVALPSNIKLKPIDMTSADGDKKAPSIPQSSTTRKERAPKPGNRFQPYVPPQHPYQPAQHYPTPQPQRHPHLAYNQQAPVPYSQPVLPYHVNPGGMHRPPYAPNRGGPYNGPNPPPGHAMRAFQGHNQVTYNQYLARVNQRIEAERSTQMTRDLLYEAMLRFN